jgi:hypothetical protein
MDKWQPIETAPKDRDILIACPSIPSPHPKVVIGGWEPDAHKKNARPYWSHSGPMYFARKHQPTHWMPLPDLPDGTVGA